MSGILVVSALDVSIRVCAIALVVAGVLRVVGLRQSVVVHAAWTAVLVVMLLLPVLIALVPDVSLPMPASLQAFVAAQDGAAPERPGEWTINAVGNRNAGGTSTAEAAPPLAIAPRAENAGLAHPQTSPLVRWRFLVLHVYLAGVAIGLGRLGVGWLLLRRLLRTATPVRSLLMSAAVTEAGVEVRESSALAVPATVGVWRPRILLPVSWRTWPPGALAAVLAHERAHVRRRDTLISAISHFNRSVFWFHPVAWWLDRRLAVLAEHAADEAAVLEVGGARGYADVLLGMAEAVRCNGRRVIGPAVGIDGASVLSQRIARVLRKDFRPDSRRRQACAAGIASVATLFVIACQPAAVAPLAENPAEAGRRTARAAQQTRVDAARAGRSMTDAEASALQAAWEHSQADLEAANKLLHHYHPSMIPVRREIALWLVQHRPDSELNRLAVIPLVGRFADPAGHEQVGQIWRTLLARPDLSARALGNAADFFAASNPQLAEQALLRAIQLEPGGESAPAGDWVAGASWTTELGNLYASWIRHTAATTASNDFVRDLRVRLPASRDAKLLAAVGARLTRHIPMRLTLVNGKPEVRPEQPDLQYAETIGLGRSYLERALALEPTNGVAWEALTSRVSEDRWDRLERLANGSDAQLARIEQFPDADRMLLLLDFAESAYRRGEDVDYFAGRPQRASPRPMAVPAQPPIAAQAKAQAQHAWDASRKAATEALNLANTLTSHPDRGVAIYRASLTLGLLRMRAGDRRAAIRYMNQAADAPPPPAPPYALSRLEERLTSTLLKYGERESVARFLERAGPLKGPTKDQALKDAALIRAGVAPSFYATYYPAEPR